MKLSILLLYLVIPLTICAQPASPAEVEKYKAKGYTLYKKGKYTEALEQFEKAIAAGGNGELAPLYDKKGDCYLELEQYPAAIEAYNKALELNPDYRYALNGRGLAKGRSGDEDAAIADFDTLIARYPQIPLYQYNRGIFSYNKKAYEVALPYFDRAIELKNDYTDAYVWRGKTRTKLKFYDGALVDLNVALNLDPKHERAILSRVHLYLVTKQYEKALTDANRAIKINPKFSYNYSNRALALYHLGQYKKAIKDCNKALKLNPNNLYAINNRAIAWAGLEQYDKACADWQLALAMGYEYKEEWKELFGLEDPNVLVKEHCGRPAD